MKNILSACMFVGATISLQAQQVQTPPNPFGKALIPDMIADASIQEIDGTYFCYATTDGYGQARNFGASSSVDLQGFCQLVV